MKNLLLATIFTLSTFSYGQYTDGNTVIVWSSYKFIESLEGGEGYWLVADTNFTFEYNIPDGISLAKDNFIPEVPKDFTYMCCFAPRGNH